MEQKVAPLRDQENMDPCHPFCLLLFLTFFPGTTGASLTTSPSQITIGGSSPTSQLTVSCRPDAPGITQVYNMEIGKKSSTGSNVPVIRIDNTGSPVRVVDTSLQQRMTTSGSLSGATGSIQLILTDLKCADAASTYYCTSFYLTGAGDSDEATANITARTYPEQTEMFSNPDRLQYDVGQVLSMRCTARIGNQFDENNLQNLWTWEYRSVENEFSSWQRYENDQNITYDTPISAGDCQYTGASTLVHAVSSVDNGKQFRCSVLSADYSANKTVYVIGQRTLGETSTSTSGQQPSSRPTTTPETPACATYVQKNQESSLGVGVAIGVCVMLAVDAICLGLAFVFRGKIVECISGPKNTRKAEKTVFANIQAPDGTMAPVGIEKQGVGDEYEVPVDKNDYDALQREGADVPNTYEEIRSYQNV